MNPTLLTVVAEMLAKPGKEEELKQRVLALVEPTRKEEGCVQYDLHQGTEEPGRFVFYENWTSKAALDLHMATPHLQGLVAVLDDLVAEPARIFTYHRIA